MSGSVRLESTRSGTLYLPANSTERICSTFEPRLASSSISSKVILSQAPGFGHDARIGGVDPVHVGVDEAFVGLERGRERHGRGVGAAAPERGDVAFGSDALETGDHHHGAVLQVGTQPLLVDVLDARLGVGVVGEDAHLAAGVALRLEPGLHQRHRQKPDGDLLAGRSDHIEFARVGTGLNFARQRDEPVGFSTHCRNDDNELMSGRLPFGHAAGDGLDAFDGSDRGPAVLVND